MYSRISLSLLLLYCKTCRAKKYSFYANLTGNNEVRIKLAVLGQTMLLKFNFFFMFVSYLFIICNFKFDTT